MSLEVGELTITESANGATIELPASNKLEPLIVAERLIQELIEVIKDTTEMGRLPMEEVASIDYDFFESYLSRAQNPNFTVYGINPFEKLPQDRARLVPILTVSPSYPYFLVDVIGPFPEGGVHGLFENLAIREGVLSRLLTLPDFYQQLDRSLKGQELLSKDVVGRLKAPGFSSDWRGRYLMVVENHPELGLIPHFGHLVNIPEEEPKTLTMTRPYGLKPSSATYLVSDIAAIYGKRLELIYRI